jgi:hypothetical protein
MAGYLAIKTVAKFLILAIPARNDRLLNGLNARHKRQIPELWMRAFHS